MERETLAAHTWEEIKRSETLAYELAILYQKEKGVAPCCAGTLEQYHQEIQQQKPKRTMTPKSVNFRLKPDTLIYVQSWHKHVSTEGITDQEAERLLREMPSHIKDFELVPQELLDELKLTLDVAGTEPTPTEPTEPAEPDGATEPAEPDGSTEPTEPDGTATATEPASTQRTAKRPRINKP